MRTLLLAATALAALPSAANATTRNFGIQSFTKVRVEGPYRVTLTTGVPPFARAEGSTTGIERIALEVRGDTLVIRTDPSGWGGYPGETPGPVQIMIGTHDLTSAALTGAGSLSINRVQGLSFALNVQGSGGATIDDVAADQMEVNLFGTASAKLKGKALKLTALARGLSSIDAAGLTTPDAHLTADGTATIDANVTDTARIDAWGPATIRLTGQPNCTLKVSGSTSVSGCR